MARREKKRGFLRSFSSLPSETKRAVAAILFFAATILFLLAAGQKAGVAGRALFSGISYLFGVGYYLVPILTLTLSIILIRPLQREVGWLKMGGSLLLFLSALGLVDIFASTRGGEVGTLISSPFLGLFDLPATIAILITLFLVAFFVLFEAKFILHAPLWLGALLKPFKRRAGHEPTITDYRDGEEGLDKDGSEEGDEKADEEEEVTIRPQEVMPDSPTPSGFRARMHGAYVPPPLSLFERDKGKPGVGDIKANANIIKRTFQNFGISVEMDEVSIGPTVTRYALKPAEGVRLSKIVSLENNLELALASHPVRIEAPIPGKSLVGIEVPNSTKAIVGFSTLLSSPEFISSDKPLLLALGRDIAGSPILANLAKMPHLLIAGATGSGKSATLHALINSLLYRN